MEKQECALCKEGFSKSRLREYGEEAYCKQCFDIITICALCGQHPSTKELRPLGKPEELRYCDSCIKIVKNLRENIPNYSNLIMAQYAVLNERSGRSTLFLWYLPSGLVTAFLIGFSLVVDKVLWIQGVFAFFLGLFSFIIFFGMHQNHFYLRKAIRHMRIIEGEIGLLDITDTPQTLKAKKTIGTPSKYLYFYGWLRNFILIIAIFCFSFIVSWLYRNHSWLHF